MPANFYGSGLYGSGLLYGRIAAGLLAAQEAESRETALRVKIIDERVNRWEYFAGTVGRPSGADFKFLGNDATIQSYGYYRLQYGAVKLANGNIVRVRVGDGGFSDFAIYTQTITDPTIAAQWTTWALLYSGVHYSVAIAANGNTAHVYSVKSDGLYRDNVLQWTQNNIISIAPVIGTFDALFITTVDKDYFDGYRAMYVWYTNDITSVTPDYDPVNYRWGSITSAALLLSDGSVLRYQSMPKYDPRSRNNGDSITVAKMPAINDNTPTAPRLIRGLAGEVGHNILRVPHISSMLSDGFYYLMYSEGHRDNDYELTENPGSAVQWQRSKDGIHWSEPVTAGTPNGIMIEQSGYVWLITHELIYRRPATSVEYEISNYIPKLNFDIPRNNQEGSGSCIVANPGGINNSLLSLSDRRLRIEVGLKTVSGTYEYAQFNDWWIKRVIENIDGAADRLSIEFGDIWVRLSSTLRDTFNFIGQLKWKDWGPTHRNKAFNYFFVSDRTPKDADEKLATGGVCLYTGWKGQNGTAQAHFSSVSGNPAIIFRYIDAKNYHRLEKQGSSLHLIEKSKGVDFEYDSDVCTSDTSPTLKIVFKWERYEAYVNGTLILFGGYLFQENVAAGYVGFSGTGYTITSFSFDDWEATLTAEELVRTALAMGDYHDVSTGETPAEELGIIWGPQTDVPTPADGLRQALEAVKWELVWTDGRIRVGQFKDLSIIKTINNRIIKTDYVDEANRHINQAAVDGNDDPWLETDVPDTIARDRQISSYFDLPELTTLDAVRDRAIEEIRRGKLGRTPGGDIPLYFDLWRMDVITWIDNAGKSNNVRVEGISVDITQDDQPAQHETVDTSLTQ